jgi:hypothetical protein
MAANFAAMLFAEVEGLTLPACGQAAHYRGGLADATGQLRRPAIA